MKLCPIHVILQVGELRTQDNMYGKTITIVYKPECERCASASGRPISVELEQ